MRRTVTLNVVARRRVDRVFFRPRGFKDEMDLHPHNPQSYGEITVIRPDGPEITALTDNPWEDATPRWDPLRVK